MTNRHCATLADVWKHLVLAEVLNAQRPECYAETHAGHAVYPLADDSERRYGVRRYLATDHSTSNYRDVVTPFVTADPPRYLGSSAIAMSIVPDARMLLCDIDPDSVADLRAWTPRLGGGNVEVVETDGMPAVAHWLERAPADRTVVHVDPFDPWAGTLSAVAFAADVVERGYGLVYWYGYDHPDERAWALAELGSADLWAGDLLVTTAGGLVEDDGDLGERTTPGTGCGVVLANIDPAVARRCERLGEALVAAYAGARLPDGREGALDLLIDVC